MSKIFIFSGHFGSGKSLVSYSFVPLDHKPKTPIHRLVLDHEIRFDTYLSPDGSDHPEKMQFAFIPLGKGRIGGAEIFRVLELVHTKKYTNKPDVIIMDDVAMSQGKMSIWWQNKENCMATAKLYGLENDRCLTSKTWKPLEPGTVSFFKALFTEFMLDCKDQDITLILTSPLHNIWKNYGKQGYDPVDNLPNMRIIGKSAKVWDCWQQMADVIWILDRHDKTGKLTGIPTISMDVQIPKASLPGVPESFQWPGWTTLWSWYTERKFVADVSKLEMPKPEFEQEQLDKLLQKDKAKFVKEMQGIATIQQITEALQDPMAPTYSIEGRQEVREFVELWIKQRTPKQEALVAGSPTISDETKAALSSGNVVTSKPPKISKEKPVIAPEQTTLTNAENPVTHTDLENNPPEEPPME